MGISKGSAPDYFYVPDVVGLSLKNGNRAIVNAGLSKAYSLPGLRLGWSIGSKSYIDPIINYIDFTIWIT